MGLPAGNLPTERLGPMVRAEPLLAVQPIRLLPAALLLLERHPIDFAWLTVEHDCQDKLPKHSSPVSSMNFHVEIIGRVRGGRYRGFSGWKTGVNTRPSATTREAQEERSSSAPLSWWVLWLQARVELRGASVPRSRGCRFMLASLFSPAMSTTERWFHCNYVILPA